MTKPTPPPSRRLREGDTRRTVWIEWGTECGPSFAVRARLGFWRRLMWRILGCAVLDEPTEAPEGSE